MVNENKVKLTGGRMPDLIRQHIAVTIRKHTEQGVPLHIVVDELAKEWEELLQEAAGV